MLFVRPATRDDAGDIARIDVETWRTSYAGILPDKVLLGLTNGRLAGEWQSQLSHRPDDVRVAEWTGAGVIGFGSCGAIRNRTSFVCCLWRRCSRIPSCWTNRQIISS